MTLCHVCNEFIFTPEKTDNTIISGYRLMTAKRGCIWVTPEEVYHEDCYTSKFGPLKKPEDLEPEPQYCPTCGQLMPTGEEDSDD